MHNFFNLTYAVTPFITAELIYHKFFIIGLVLECPTLYLNEICEATLMATNVEVSVPTVY